MGGRGGTGGGEGRGDDSDPRREAAGPAGCSSEGLRAARPGLGCGCRGSGSGNPSGHLGGGSSSSLPGAVCGTAVSTGLRAAQGPPGTGRRRRVRARSGAPRGRLRSALRLCAQGTVLYSSPSDLEVPWGLPGFGEAGRQRALPGAHLSSGAARCPLPILAASSRALPRAPEAECSSLREGSMLARCLLSD